MNRNEIAELPFLDSSGPPIYKAGLLDLPLECLRHIFAMVVKYDENSETNLRDAVSLLRVSKIFEAEIMRAISVTKLLRRMRKNPEVAILRVYARRTLVSQSCRSIPEGFASSFLARYIIFRPQEYLPWDANLVTVINSIVDAAIRKDDLDMDVKQRFRYTRDICRHAISPQPSSDSPISENGMWVLFEPYLQSMLFPHKQAVIQESLESLILPAKIYLKDPGVDNMIFSLVLSKGPKALSTFRSTTPTSPENNAEKPQKLARRKPLLGSLLDAAIRSGNKNLAAFLIKYEVDISREKPPTVVGVKVTKRKRYYDQYFYRLAVECKDIETLTDLLESSDTEELLPTHFFQLLMRAPPSAELELPGPRWMYFRPRLNMLEYGLEEAMVHRHVEIFGLLLESPLAQSQARHLRLWERLWGSPWSSEKMSHVGGKSPIEIAAERGDEAEIRSLLSAGASPHGLKPQLAACPCDTSSSTQLRDLMPMIAAAKNWQAVAARLLVEGGFECYDIHWLLIIGTVITSRSEPGTSGLSRPFGGADTSQDYQRALERRDVAFWQKMLDEKIIGLQHVYRNCPRCEDRFDSLSRHNWSIHVAKDFVRNHLRIVPDGTFRPYRHRDWKNVEAGHTCVRVGLD
ncbi:uncharacterized protein CTRU02_209178 [Colletotrichum truncatum]|uniref:Uncharacterized protein n=1 Tax=Colletotrichum truncatum TaxID=5467 RepID=A0ACC3YZR8_COLTU|nr:uncharacterized protein CTRU02_14515 [Colletotrichum truncatum]KAF6782071.1 hypothetical protein CTRU02_14515 [Colletotrichum truncatum]